MATMTAGVLGSFIHIDAAVDAIRALQAQGHKDLTVYSPAPNHELEEVLDHPVSPVRLFTLVGALTGCAAGFAMTIWMSNNWPLLVGGKPFASVPPYVVFAFELMILFGALSTVAGIIIMSAVQARRRIPYDEKFSDDHIGVFVPCRAEQAATVEGLLRRAGSVEVTHAA
jgi:molybdopterin-containing oxidoreductase family membrane subunit